MLYKSTSYYWSKNKYFLFLKVGHISEGFKMADEKRYFSDFSGLRDLQWPYEFG